MKILLLWVSIIIFSCTVKAQEFLPLWAKGKMPNSKGMELDHIEENERITQVEKPGIYKFLPAAEEQNGSSVLIIPSGGYQKLTYNLGGFQLAKWFNAQGIAAFVLIYRLPNSPDLKIREEGPVQDAQRAMKIIRSKTQEWNLNKKKIGVFGSSAGGHLASILATRSEDFSKIEDSLYAISFQPNFMILVSPVINLQGNTHQGSVENFLGENPSEEELKKYSAHLQVNEGTPPTFIAHAQNDAAVPVENSLLFYKAILEKNVKGSLHIFPQGGHKIGLVNASGLTDLWKNLCASWLNEIVQIKN